MKRPALLIFLVALLMGSTGCEHANNASPQFVDRVAPFKGSSIHYVDVGQGSVPLLFVHGWGAHKEFWRAEIDDLSRDHRVIAVDLPGHGRSSELKQPYTQQTFADAVLAVMDSAGAEHVVLIGHSMGASVIRHVALKAPERVSALVLVDGAFLFPPKGAAERRTWEKQIAEFVKQLDGPGSEDFTRSFIEEMHGTTTPQWAKDEVLSVIMATPQPVRVSAMNHFLDRSAWPRTKLSQPVLGVYVTSKDPGQATLESDLRGMFPRLELERWDGPGHFYLLYESERLNAQIRQFLNRHNPVL